MSLQDDINALIVLFNQGNLAATIAGGEALLAREPQPAVVYEILAAAHFGCKQSERAADCLRGAIKIAPNNAVTHFNLGAILNGLGQKAEAIACYERAVQIKPDYAEALHNLGSILKGVGRTDEAIACTQRALRIKPDNAESHNNLGVMFQELGRKDEAIASYQRALQISAGNAEIHNNLGVMLSDTGRKIEAAVHCERALKINPAYAEAHNNLGVALQDLGRKDEAALHYRRAIEIKPDYAEAHNNLGVTLQELGRLDEAIACYQLALRIRPDYSNARVQKLHQQAHICDWDGVGADADLIPSLGIAGGAVAPSPLLSLEDHPARHRLRSENYAAAKYRQAALPAIPRPRFRPERLRIGYFSADFHNHATMYLMAKLFETHDRGKFSLHAYSYGPDENDAMRQRLKRAVDVFHDVRVQGDKDIAELARRESIDIAVDLKGYTQHARLGVFAYRAAPIQMSYIGYPGTMGAPFIDYIVADAVVIPEEQRQHYSEKIVTLPHSYQVNDNTRAISDRTMQRSEAGLPATGFVFCSFNNTYKITPEEFDIWMRLLQKVDGSVLWLLRANVWAEGNLIREARKRGIPADRLIYADRVPLNEHLARHRLADLFLDTFTYNAHTTASDALWAGLPVITTPGQGFAARVAASLLNAVGMPELVTPSKDAYERLALSLATNPDKLAAIKSKLLANRSTKPLFDTELFARHIEDAYEQAYKRWLNGKDPDALDVKPIQRR